MEKLCVLPDITAESLELQTYISTFRANMQSKSTTDVIELFDYFTKLRGFSLIQVKSEDTSPVQVNRVSSFVLRAFLAHGYFLRHAKANLKEPFDSNQKEVISRQLLLCFPDSFVQFPLTLSALIDDLTLREIGQLFGDFFDFLFSPFSLLIILM